MAKLLNWGNPADHKFETGLDQGVLFVRNNLGAYPVGVAWQGLISVTEKPGGSEPTDLYSGNAKYATLQSSPTFEGSIEAYYYPQEEWGLCDGSITYAPGVRIGQQARATFGLSYRTQVGDDAAGMAASYNMHIVYGALAQPSEASRQTVNESPEAATFSWDFKTTPLEMPDDMAPAAHLVFNSADVTPAFWDWLVETLHGKTGTPNVPATLPLPTEILAQVDLLN